MIRGTIEHWNVKNEIRYNVEPIIEAKGITVIWDFVIQNDRKIKRYKVDVVFKGY